MSRPRHQVKELEAVLRQAERRGWRIDKGKKYFGMRCPCGKHQRRVHLTPSNPNYELNLRNPNYELNLRKWLQRQPCWKDGTDR